MAIKQNVQNEQEVSEISGFEHYELKKFIMEMILSSNHLLRLYQEVNADYDAFVKGGGIDFEKLFDKFSSLARAKDFYKVLMYTYQAMKIIGLQKKLIFSK